MISPIGRGLPPPLLTINQNGGSQSQRSGAANLPNTTPPKIMNLLKVDNKANQSQKISSILRQQEEEEEEELVVNSAEKSKASRTSGTTRSLSVSSTSRSSSGSEMMMINERDNSQVGENRSRVLLSGSTEVVASKCQETSGGKALDVLSPARVNQVLIPKWMLAGKFTNASSSSNGVSGSEKSNRSSQPVQSRFLFIYIISHLTNLFLLFNILSALLICLVSYELT